MDQHYPPPHNPQPPPRPPVPHVVHIRAKPGGWWAALGLVFGLMLFVFVFITGIVLGATASRIDPPRIIEQTYRDGGRDRIAIIPVENVIWDREMRFVRAAVDHVLANRRFRAVVLRVDSPGGAVAASDQIWYQIERLKQAGIPVVASYGGVAASGGYYISCATDHIFAEPTTVTGSIGVIAQIFTLHGLADKVGIQPVTLVASGSPDKDVANNLFREWTEHDQHKVLSILDAAYETFNRRVRDGRSKVITDPQRVNELADGSVFTAAEAAANGLVDSIGYLDDAIAHAEQLAGVTTGRARVIQLKAFATLLGGDQLVKARDGGLGLDPGTLRSTVTELAMPRVMYLMW
jgi:protease IV